VGQYWERDLSTRLEIFKSILHPKPIRLLGVGVSQLKKEWCQMDLFEKREKKDHLAKAMDQVNQRLAIGP